MAVHPGSLFFQEHLARYTFARDRLRPGGVLDMACGTGYGTDLFAHLAGHSTVGVDLDGASVRAARLAFPDPAVRFCIASGTQLPFVQRSFQNIVSLETIEHVQDDRALLSEMVRVLDPNGVCILSTPNRLYSLERGIQNPYHVREYVEEELRDLLGSYFGTVSVFYQGFADPYHARVQGYAASIEIGKRNLPAPLAIGLERLYQPAKSLIPMQFKNYGVRRLLGLEYPQPDPADIIISALPVTGISNFVLVCEEPR
jgi:ubiquinone/menaquinone biosynthesis C-methylase UbiE